MSQVSYPHLVLLHGVCMAGDSEPHTAPHPSPGSSSTLLDLHASDTLKIITPIHTHLTPQAHTQAIRSISTLPANCYATLLLLPTPSVSWLYLFG